MQLEGRRYVTQESVIRWHVERADQLTFYLFDFSLHLELFNSSENYVKDVANYANSPCGNSARAVTTNANRNFLHITSYAKWQDSAMINCRRAEKAATSICRQQIYKLSLD